MKGRVFRSHLFAIVGGMKVVRFSSFKETEHLFTEGLQGHEVVFVQQPLSFETAPLAAGADAVSVFVDCDVSRPVIDALPSVKLIVSESTGVDHVDVDYLKEKKIELANVPGYGVNAVAEFTFGLMLNLTRKISFAAEEVQEEGKFDLHGFQGFDLAGKTLGVVGTGRIGTHVIEIAHGFSMNVVAFDVHTDEARAAQFGFSYVSLGEIAEKSDIITLHVPYTPETHHLLDKDFFSRIKQGAILINTARGEVVDTTALVEVLKSGKLGGAGLDVLEGERELHREGEILGGVGREKDLRALLGDHMLMDMPNVIVTPHLAFHSKEADDDRVARAVKAAADFAARV